MKRYVVKLVILFLVCNLAAIIFAVAMVKVPEYTSRERIEAVDKYAEKIDEIAIPDEAMIVGIGEATHGNKEFQTAKLDVLKLMCREGSCHSIAFEMPSGDASRLNDCVHQSDLDIKEALKNLSYPLYSTAEMEELVTWIRDYNATVSESESINIYGVDMQVSSVAAYYVAEYLTETGMDDIGDENRARLTEINSPDFMGLEESDEAVFDEVISVLTQRYNESVKNNNFEESNKIWQALYNSQNIKKIYGEHAMAYDDDPDAYSDYRDTCMLENLDALLMREKERGFGKILISAHNGHLMKGDSLSYGSITYGQKIFEKYGNGYFVIGTDFFNASVNIGTHLEEDYIRDNHEFCSTNPLAAQAERMEDGTYYLDFSKVSQEDEELYNIIHSTSYIGLVGEEYNIFTDIFVNYRFETIQAESFDAMIYVYNATPIEPYM